MASGREITQNNLEIIYGDPAADIWLLQPMEDRELKTADREISEIRRFIPDASFCMITAHVQDWNRQLSPWFAPAVFGDENFAGEAEEFLQTILQGLAELQNTYGRKKIVIGGYSLAALFALWAGYQTGAFAGIAAASPSVWYPDWIEYAREHRINADTVYLSLGNKEAKTRNPVMKTVADSIETQHRILCEKNIRCTLEWNPGNHFRDPEIRTAKAFAWALKQLTDQK